MSVLDTISISSLAAADALPGRGFWMPERASTVAGDVDFAFNLITWISVFFFVLIVAVMAIFIVKYRRTNGREAEQTVTHHTALELTWTIIPLILVIIIFYVGMVGYLDLRTSPVDAYEVRVTGQKWFWTFEHPSGCIEVDVLRVPVNRPVRLVMGSDDVIHSLFIPAFRVKQDVVPGRYTTLWFEATRTGTFDLFCTEYCGTGHAQMVGHVIVYDEDEFDDALRECREWIEDIDDAQLHLAGANLFNRCQACHSLDGSPGIGPSFLETHEYFHDRRERDMIDGTRALVDENYLRQSILNPRWNTVAGYQPGQMPVFQGQLSERQLRSLIEFIKRLDEIELDDRGRPQVLSPDQIRELGGDSPNDAGAEQ